MKKTFCTVLALMMCTAMFVGCNPPAVADTETNIIVEYFESALGRTTWDKLAEGFEAENPEYTVTMIPNTQLLGQLTESKLQSGPSINTVDILISGDLEWRRVVDAGDSYYKGYEFAIEPLDDLYEETAVGEGVLIGEKMDSAFSDYFKFRDHYWAMPMTGGPNGIAYRSDYFENEGWDVPVTTQEMAELIVKMKGKGYTPFIWPGKYGYWSYIVLPWWAQYAGDQGIEDFWNCLDTNGELSEDAYRQYARYEAFAALETMIGDTSNSHEKSMTEDHMATQNLFYADSNKICMMPNGEWLENEMKKSGYQPGDKDIGLMRPPVLSSILKDGNTDRFETIKTEEKLREVIRVIDAEGECPDDVDPEEFAALTKIRSYVYTTGFQMSAIIPAYSNAKEGAKKFLAFVASDKGNQIYYNESGSVLPYDQSGLVRSQNETQYQKDRAKIERNATFISILDSSNKMFYKGGLKFFMDIPELKIGTSSTTDKMSAYDYWMYEYGLVADRFDTYKALAGM